MIYKIVAKEGKSSSVAGHSVGSEIGEAIFVDTTAEKIKSYEKDENIAIKKYTDPVPEGFEVHKI